MTGNLFLDILIIAFIALVVAGAIVLIVRFGNFESPQRRAGRLGEQFATRVIAEVLNEGDALFTNVGVYADGKVAADQVFLGREHLPKAGEKSDQAGE